MIALAAPRSRGATWRMVPAITAAASIVIFGPAALAEAQPPLLKRLDEQTRAKVLSALAGLIILGFAMVLLAWLGARIVQRYRRGASYFRPTSRPKEHDWARKPLASDDSDS